MSTEQPGKLKTLPQVAFGVCVAVLWAMMMLALGHVYPVAGDMVATISRWWDYIASTGFRGISTVGSAQGADYTSIWYFIIFVFTKIGLAHHIAICLKGLSIAGTVVASVATYFIVDTIFPKANSWRPLLAAAIVPFLPAFFLDTLKTSMPDSVYLALDLLVLLAALRRRPILAWFLLGIAISFKLMAIYIAPFLVLIYLVNVKKMSILQKLSPLATAFGVLLISVPGCCAGLSLYQATVGTWVARSTDAGSGGGLLWGIWRILFGPSSQWMPDIWNLGVGPAAGLKAGTGFGLASIVLVLISLIALTINARDAEALTSCSLDLLIVSPVIFFLLLPSQHESYGALASVMALLALMIRWSRSDFIILLVLNFILVEMYMGARLFQPIVYEYLLVAVAMYLFARIFMRSELHMALRNPRLPTIER